MNTPKRSETGLKPCVFMPFGCVFPLLCVFFGYVCTCACFCSAIFRRVFAQMTCALNFVPFSLFSCLLDVFSLCCVCFLDMSARVVVFVLRFSDVYLCR